MADRDKPSTRYSLKLVASDVAPHRALIPFGVLALLLEVASRVLEPWPLKIVVDAATASRGVKVSHQPVSVELLVGCGVALLLIVGSRTLSNYLAIIYFALVGSRAATSLRARVLRHVQSLSQQFHVRNHSADTVQRIVGDIAWMQEVAITTGLPLMVNVVALLVMVVVMPVLDPLLASVVLVTAVAFAVTSDPTPRKTTAVSRQTRKGEGQLVNTVQEFLASIHVVQAYGLENLVEENFISVSHTSLREGVRSRRYAARLECTIDVIVGLATVTVLVGGGLWVMQDAMSPGNLVSFITYLRTTMKPLCDVAKYTGRTTWTNASGERVADPMEITPDVVTPDEPARPDIVMGAVWFDRVITEYDGVEVLRDLCLDIRFGERVAIIGPSEAGKSALVSLLVRVTDPVSGCVRLDGRRLTDLDLTQLRASVSLLHQEAVLFTGTIRENIRTGRGDATDAEVEGAARAANAHDFITEQPDGYDTVVGERSGTLPSGQRQQIAITQVLLRRSPVVVSDEVTTGLDSEAANLVPDAVDRFAMGRTILAVTHDAEVTLRAARVVQIEDGRTRLGATSKELIATSDMSRVWVQTSGHDVDSIRTGGSR